MSVLNVFDFFGRMCWLLSAAGGFYFLSNDYFIVGGKVTDFSLFAWGGMLALWGTGLWRAYKRKKPAFLMFAVAVTLVTAAFDCCRFLIYATDTDYFLYIEMIMAAEAVFALAALKLRCKTAAGLFSGSLILSYFGTLLIFPQICPLSYIYAVAGIYALLWGAACLAKEKGAYYIAAAGLAGLVLLFAGIAVLFYLRLPGIRFYEAKITEPAKEVKVSIVIPVYNAEEVIERCLDSLRRQTLKDIEIIAVDDGSTDGTPAILAEYAAHDARIRVIRQENAYIGAARNRGLRAAKGTYVGFVDNDDYVSPDYYEALYQTAKEKNADAVITGSVQSVWQRRDFFQKVVGDETKFHNKHYDVFLKFQQKYAGFVWTKIYKKSFLADNNIWFATERTPLEDAFFSVTMLMYLDDLPLAKSGTYFHTIKERVTESSSGAKIKDELFEMLKHLESVINNAPAAESKKAAALKYLNIYKKIHLKSFYHNLKEEDKPKFKERCLALFAAEECDNAMKEYRKLTEDELLARMPFNE